MRRFALATVLLAAFVPSSASAHGIVGAPLTHGPDPAGVGAGPEAPLHPGARGKEVASGLPATWCGTEQAQDDTAHELDNGPYRYHAVYMLAADAPDRFGSLAGTLQTDAFQASALLETSYGRAIRFDLGTSCGPQYLDISVVRMPQTSAEMAALAGQPNGTFDAVSNALAAAGFQPIRDTDSLEAAAARTRNYVVWVDAPTAPGTCGEAAIYDDPSRSDANLNNLGGKVALVYRNGGDAFCSSNAVRHEIGHNLGGLQALAPHAFDGSHCDDAYEDTMCYSNAPKVADGQRGRFFDYGNDDYWSPPGGAPLPWWTVDLNRFLCPDASCNVVAGAVGPSSPSPPAPSTPDPAAGAPATAAGASTHHRRAHLRMRAARHGRRLWKLRLHASGEGSGVVTVRCRRRAHGQVRTVLVRRTRLPRTLHGRVRCMPKSRPRARLLLQQ
jgi:hypothetical protein